VVSISPESRASFAAHFGLSLAATHGKLVTLLRMLGADRVLDMQLARRVAVLESRVEFEEHLRSCEREGRARPLLASSCPGWICFAEKSHPEALPYVSRVRSPQQIMGQLVKKRLASEAGWEPARVYHACLMMCYDKKLEATRDDFCEEGVRQVDTVLASSELLTVLRERGIRFEELEESADPGGERADLRGDTEGSGSQAADLFRHAAWALHGVRVEQVPFKAGRNPDVREAVLEVGGRAVLKVGIANGFRNIQNLVRKLKTTDLHFVEVMACPSGCLNGGGQIRAENAADREEARAKLRAVTSVFATAASDSEDFREALLPFYRAFVGGEPGSEAAKQLFHTEYHAVPPMESGLVVNW
jgi:iron only hydrogenase large subunit-like protein